MILALATALWLTACGGGGGDASLPTAEPAASTLGPPIGTVEIDIIGLGSAKPGSVVHNVNDSSRTLPASPPAGQRVQGTAPATSAAGSFGAVSVLLATDEGA